MPPIVGRLAPSPTGAQHVGNARTYLLAWLSLRSRGGRVILRIEDIDSPRVKRDAAEQAIEDLRWLGLDWDEGPDVGGPNAPYVQSNRLDRYQAALERLQRDEHVYPCTCSRSDVESAASAPHGALEGPTYPGTCRGLRVADAAALLGRRFCWRLRSDGVERRFVDRFRGPERSSDHPSQGDFVVWKNDQTPAYQLAVVVDDAAMGMTEVLRGDDLVPSTFRQLELYERLDLPVPEFVHVPLVVGPDGRRLAKRHGDTRLATLRAEGVSAERLVGLLACSAGLRDGEEPLTPRELLGDFDLGKVPHAPYIWNEPGAWTAS